MLAVIERLTDMPQGTIGFRAGALWADTRLGFDLGVRHHQEWIRSAIVTDIHWMARATTRG